MEVMLTLRTAWFSTFVALACAGCARAGDFQIVPGQRIGTVVLGMSRQTVHHILHLPSQAHRRHDGTLQESWLSRRKISRAAVDEGIYWKWNFVTVYFRHNRVVQVEVNSSRFTTSSKLSTKSSATKWEKAFKPFRSNAERGTSRDLDGYPAVKHFMVYDDAVQSGIAWRYGGWANLAPDMDSDGPLEIAIVHAPGQRVIPDPDGSNRFMLTSVDMHLSP